MTMRTSFRMIIFTSVFAVSVPTIAQDFHLSQYDMAPLYYNPAVTGMQFEQDMKFRIAANYRSQWQKLQGKPYSSVCVGYDMPIDRFGAGILIMDHIAGTSNFGTFQFLASGAYQITDPESKKHFLSTGIQIGFMQKRFNQGNLLFESQYTSDGLDPNMDSGELLDRQSIVRLDANMGIFYKYTDPNKRFDPSVGFSVYHVNMPNESFTGQMSRLPMRFNLITNCDIHINETFIITPNVLLMYQRKATEINAGALMGYKFNESNYTLLAGGSYRHKDAVIIHAGIRQGNNVFRISYDLITSPLKNFGGVRGGFEMGVIYTGVGRGGGGVRSSMN